MLSLGVPAAVITTVTGESNNVASGNDVSVSSEETASGSGSGSSGSRLFGGSSFVSPMLCINVPLNVPPGKGEGGSCGVRACTCVVGGEWSSAKWCEWYIFDVLSALPL